MTIHYLEIVTNDVDGTIAMYEAAQGLEFGAPTAALGNARTAAFPTGETIGIRSPMHDAESPVVRPYYLTEALLETIDKVEQLGAEIALPPMAIDSHGIIAIYIIDGLHYGLWQL